MIYITGDLHGTHDVHKLTTKAFPEQKQLGKNDYVIICGDFGFVWCGDKEDEFWLKWLDMKNFTTLFVDGNHENHRLLSEYPATEFCGGKVHKVSKSVYHLMRGQVFVIEEKMFFTMGGAQSTDKKHRKEGISWWAQEMPSKCEYNEAVVNLQETGNSVDYIISHCAPGWVQNEISTGEPYNEYPHNELSEFFNAISLEVSYKKWYFGHYHQNREIDDTHICLYDRIIRLGQGLSEGCGEEND